VGGSGVYVQLLPRQGGPFHFSLIRNLRAWDAAPRPRVYILYMLFVFPLLLLSFLCVARDTKMYVLLVCACRVYGCERRAMLTTLLLRGGGPSAPEAPRGRGIHGYLCHRPARARAALLPSTTLPEPTRLKTKRDDTNHTIYDRERDDDESTSAPWG
jgi:hypothetical protein